MGLGHPHHFFVNHNRLLCDNSFVVENQAIRAAVLGPPLPSVPSTNGLIHVNPSYVVQLLELIELELSELVLRCNVLQLLLDSVLVESVLKLELDTLDSVVVLRVL
jgi:hypothetical protein